MHIRSRVVLCGGMFVVLLYFLYAPGPLFLSRPVSYLLFSIVLVGWNPDCLTSFSCSAVSGVRHRVTHTLAQQKRVSSYRLYIN